MSYVHLWDEEVAVGQGWKEVAVTVDLPQFDGIQEVNIGGQLLIDYSAFTTAPLAT